MLHVRISLLTSSDYIIISLIIWSMLFISLRLLRTTCISKYFRRSPGLQSNTSFTVYRYRHKTTIFYSSSTVDWEKQINIEYWIGTSWNGLHHAVFGLFILFVLFSVHHLYKLPVAGWDGWQWISTGHRSEHPEWLDPSSNRFKQTEIRNQGQQASDVSYAAELSDAGVFR